MPITHKSSVWNDGHMVTGPLGKLDLLADSVGYLKNDGLGNLTWAIVAGGTTPALFTSSTSGIVPASGGGTVNYLRADGTWTALSASVAWGGITGTLSSQGDLNTALNGKQPLATNLTSIGGLANAAGWLHNDGSGVFVYSSPAAASWPVSGTPAIVSTFGALANATGHLYNNGSGTLSWVAEYTLPTATSSVLGGVKPDGTSILNTAGAISATAASVGALASGGTAVLATALAAGTANQVPYQTGPGVTSFYSASNYGVHTYGATGVPASIAGAAGVLQGSAAAIPAFTTTPTLTGTNFTGIPGGAINSAVANATLAATATAVAAGTANQIPYQTGPGVTSFFSAANYGVHIYGSTGVPQSIAGAAGVLQGSAAAIPAFTTTPTLTGTNFTGVPTSGLTGTLAAAQFPILTGDVTTAGGALATTLITTQPSVHTWTLAQTFSATSVHTLGATLTASASVSTAGYVGYNSTQLAHEFYASGLKHILTGTIFTQTATGSNGSATAITDILGTGVGTRVLPANWTLTGKSVRVKCGGTVTTAATPGTTLITLRLNAGTPVTVCAMPTAVTLTASMTSMPFDIDLTLVQYSATAVWGWGTFNVASSTTDITGLVIPISNTAAGTTVNATSYTIQVCATNSVASGTVYTSRGCSIEVMN